MALKISKPVGKWDGESKNIPADVKIIQRLLTNASNKLGNKKYKPNGINGSISKAKGKVSSTVRAIIEFQKRFSDKPDGRVDPGGRTWKKLVNPNLGSGPCFPFASKPKSNWTSAPRSFGAWRRTYNKKREVIKKRLHAGCDLYFPVGTAIFAVDEGIVVADPRYFYAGTDQISIYHPKLKKTIRYGEIKKGSTKLKKGDSVEAGEQIAKVGKLNKIRNSMLHLELYKGKVEPMRVTSSASAKAKRDGEYVKYERLSSLLNPTKYLDKWQKSLPKKYLDK